MLAQTLLLWISIAGTSLVLAGRTSFTRGATLYVGLILFLRLPDAATSVMSESLTAALLLPIVAALLDPPERVGPCLALGSASALLSLVRPNAGVAAAALALVAFSVTRRWRGLAAVAVAAFVLVVPVWILTAPADGDALRGLGIGFVWARAEYGWPNAAGLSSPDTAEAARQLVWRLFHGLLGGEYFDTSWSPTWRVIDEWSRVVSPILVLVALACLLAPPREKRTVPRLLGLALAAILVVQSYLIGALPRYALPSLPALFLCAAMAWPPRLGTAAVIFVALLAGARWQRHILDRQWGRIEASGVRILQTIPRGSLSATAPSVLRVRVAPALVPSNAELLVLGPGDVVLYDSRNDTDRRRPYIDVPLTPELIAENKNDPVTLTLTSTGAYGQTQYLLFPVIPAPWASPAVRVGSADLSPSTGLRSGSLDWWVARASAP